MYGKIFETIFDSSIMEEDIETRYVWHCMIVLADVDGNVDMTEEALARRINVAVSTVSTAVHRLTQPDPRSRSAAEDGRRLVLLDEHRSWGWHLVNRERYRDIRSPLDRRDYFREQKRRKRAEVKMSTCGQSGQRGRSTVSTKAEAEAEAEAEKEEHPRATAPLTPRSGKRAAAPRRERAPDPMEGFEEWYGAYPRKKARGDAEKAWKQTAPKRVPLPEMLAALGRAVREWRAEGRPADKIPYPGTYLRGLGFLDAADAPLGPAIKVPDRLPRSRALDLQERLKGEIEERPDLDAGEKKRRQNLVLDLSAGPFATEANLLAAAEKGNAPPGHAHTLLTQPLRPREAHNGMA